MTALDELLAIRGYDEPAENRVVEGSDPVLATPFSLGEVAAEIQLAIGIAVNDLYEMRTGRRQDLAVRVEHAAATLKSYAYLRVDHAEMNAAFAQQRLRQGMSSPHRTKDGRYFLPHMGLSHLAEKILGILGCRYELDAIIRAVSQWDASELEDAVAAAGACGAMVRSAGEWLAHPQGAALSAKPVIEIIRIGDSPPEPLPDDIDERPLAGVRILDLTRILAGPTCARTLAEHGADVLMVTAEKLPQALYFVMDTGHGKRTTFLDFDREEELQRLRGLVSGADVFSQGYRPGVMEKHGLSPEELAEMRPGIIYVSMNCYGYDGPFASRAGWEQLAQAVTGMADEQGEDCPRLLPAAACDYTTGYLAAYGTLLALGLRAREGGSWHVRTSLCQSAMLIQRQRRLEYDCRTMDIDPAVIDGISLVSQTSWGEMRHLGPVLQMSETRPCWKIPSSPLGSHAPVWVTR